MTTAVAIIDRKIEEYAAEFRTVLKEGIEKACQIYYRAVCEDPKIAEGIRLKCSDLIPFNARTWAEFERVGAGRLTIPQLLGRGGNGPNRKLFRLAESYQKRIFEDGELFEYLAVDGTTQRVDLRTAEAAIIDQMIDGFRIRTPQQQKQYLDLRAREEERREIHGEILPYVISGGRITFRQNTTLTRAEIKRIALEV